MYSNWLNTYGIKELITSQSSKKIDEIFTFFLLQEEEEDILKHIMLIIENILDEIYLDYSNRLILNYGITDDWNIEAEKTFSLMDEDKKGHIEAEALQFWALSILITEANCLEPSLLRKQTNIFLQEMQHTNGLITMRGWKNYLIKKNWKDPYVIKKLSENFQRVIEIWKNIRIQIFNSDTLANYNFLNNSTQILPSIWNQCILSCLSSFTSLKNEANKIHKYLRFIGLQLGSAASTSTKGTIYIEGTHIKEITEFSVYIMENFLEFFGQYNTSASFSLLNQQALDMLNYDNRFQAIRKILQAYDNLMSIILYEIIARCPKIEESLKNPISSDSTRRLLNTSTTSILNGKFRSSTPDNSLKNSFKEYTNNRGTNSIQGTREKNNIKGTVSATRLRNKGTEYMKSFNNFASESKNIQQTKSRSFVRVKNIEARSISPKISREIIIGKRDQKIKADNSKEIIKVRNLERAKNIPQNKSRSPAREIKRETYEQVMRRLNNYK